MAYTLYTAATPNGWKVSIALEEMGLPYEVRVIDFATNEQKSDWYLKINPNGRIPSLVDDDYALFESGAILIYLAEKTGQFVPKDSRGRSVVLQWLMFQMSAIGPMFGQVGFFHKFAGKDYADKRPLERYVGESKRLLGILNRHLEHRAWIMGDEYSIADIATFPWISNLIGFYGAGELVGFSDFEHVARATGEFAQRPAVIRGSSIPQRVNPGAAK